MTQALSMKIRGLYTFPNDFSEIPEGALTVADNVVIDRDSIAEPRRGFTFLASQAGRADFLNSSDRCEKMFFYDDTIIAHTKRGSDHNLNYFDPTDGWHDISGTSAAKTVATGAGGGFDAADGDIVKTGHGFYTGLKIYLTINGGSLPAGLTTGYYYIWVVSPSVFRLCSSYDNAIAGTFILFTDQGSVGQVATFTPYSTFEPPTTTIKSRPAVAKQNLYITSRDGVFCIDDRTSMPRRVGVPQALGIYNTNIDISNATPKWLENNKTVAYRVLFGYKDLNGNIYYGAPSGRGYITNTSGSACSLDVHVILPSGLTTGHFIQLYRSKKVASTATPDDELILCYEAYLTANQVSTQLAVIADILSEDLLLGQALYTNASQQGIDSANVIPPKAGDIALFKDCMFYANIREQQTYLLRVLNVTGMATGDYIKIGPTTFYVNEPLGSGRPGWIISTGASDAINIELTAIKLVFAINFWQSDYYATYVSTPGDIPGEILIRSYSVNAPEFVLNAATSLGAQTTCWFPALPVAGGLEHSTADISPNLLASSKPDQPEAVPLRNRWPVGSKDSEILRTMALRDSLFLLKDDGGIFRLYGTDNDNWQISELDGTANVIAPDTVVVLNNQVFALTTQGVVTISETGVTIISRPIESDLLDLIQICGSVLREQSFAVAYESQRAYYLFVPEKATDTHPTQYYRYNTITSNWTRGTLAKSCGGVNPVDDLLYLGDPNHVFLDVERKNHSSYDYADYVSTNTISAVLVKEVSIASATDLLAGQVLFQTPAYSAATVATGAAGGFNETTNVITKVTFNYHTGLKVSIAIDSGSLPAGLTAGEYYVIRVSATEIKLASSYANAMAGTAVDFTDKGTEGKIVTFTPSTRTLWGEIASVGTTSVTMRYPVNFIATGAYVLDPIQCRMKWAPCTFSNPGVSKQIRELAVLFLADFYGVGAVNFQTDISQTILEEDVIGSTAAPWGRFAWGNAPWGGILRRRPMRVMVPRIHQRCSFLIVGFDHAVCFSPWAIQGISFIGNMIGERIGKEGDTV